MKENIQELYSKRSGLLHDMIEANNSPSMDEILNSRDFQTSLVGDLVSGKKNITDWSLHDNNGSIEDLTSNEDNSFDVSYNFSFKFKYNEIPVQLSLFINGTIDVRWRGSNRPATYTNPAETPQPEIDNRTFGKYLDLSLFSDEGQEISLKWVTPDLKQKIVISILSPYF